MTTSTLKPIVGLSVTATTIQLLYTVPASTTSTLIDLIVMNKDAVTTGTYQIWHVPSPGTVPGSSALVPEAKLVFDQPLIAKERQVINDREVMLTGAKLYIHCTTDVIVRGSVLEQA